MAVGFLYGQISRRRLGTGGASAILSFGKLQVTCSFMTYMAEGRD